VSFFSHRPGPTPKQRADDASPNPYDKWARANAVEPAKRQRREEPVSEEDLAQRVRHAITIKH
jgi:hypothetical protein